MIIKLHKPVEHDGKSITEINFDLDSLTGVDLEQVEKEFVAAGHSGLLPDTSKVYQAMVAARACGLPYETIRLLGAKDYSRATLHVLTFLAS